MALSGWLVGLGASELTAGERALRQRYADRAMAFLRMAVEQGHRDAHFIESDPSFELIRSRDYFQIMILDLAFPTDPFHSARRN